MNELSSWPFFKEVIKVMAGIIYWAMSNIFVMT
jgi:hypothetical protein